MIVHAANETRTNADDAEPACTNDDPPERSEVGVALSVEIAVATELPEPGLPHWLGEQLGRIAQHLGVWGEFRLRLVDDTEMVAAHRQYLNVDGTTDVLTFDLADGASARGAPVDADVLACVDEANRRSRELGHGLDRELLLYALHGLLHCLGYDDHDPEGYQRMHDLEDRLLEALGVGATFAPRPKGVEPGA